MQPFVLLDQLLFWEQFLRPILFILLSLAPDTGELGCHERRDSKVVFDRARSHNTQKCMD